MERGTAEEALIFLHVPKSAGTTVNRLIEGEYPLFQIFSVDPVFSRCRNSWPRMGRAAGTPTSECPARSSRSLGQIQKCDPRRAQWKWVRQVCCPDR